MQEQLHQEAITLLKQLIETPSFSKEEDQTAERIIAYLDKYQIAER